MGVSLSWYAVRGRSGDEVLQALELRNVGKEHCKTPFHGGALASGWFLVVHGRYEFKDREVALLSRGGEALACFVEEHVMVSRATCYKNGERIWAVTHDAQQEGRHLLVEGEPPPSFAVIRDSLRKQQEEDGGADFFFDIPVDLAREITGYSHGDPQETTFDNFVRPTFFQRLFGRSS